MALAGHWRIDERQGMKRGRLEIAHRAAAELRAAAPEALPRFDPATLEGLPDPAGRFLRRVIPEGAPLVRAVDLTMTGEIRIGARWHDFRASQVLRAGVGFVWQPTVGRLLRIVGADVLTPTLARMDFLLFGLIPVVGESGDDVGLSAAGRLAGETVVWLPHALTPQVGVRWEPIDTDRASVSVPTPSGLISVEVEVDSEGRLVGIELARWRADAEPPGPEPFGAAIHDEHRHAVGVVAGRGVAGWGWDTPHQDDEEFFRYELTDWRPLEVSADAGAAPAPILP